MSQEAKNQKYKMSDLNWLRGELEPTVTCEPPEGQTCWWSGRFVMYVSAIQAKQHALHNPGHRVVRDQVTRAIYILEVDSDESGTPAELKQLPKP